METMATERRDEPQTDFMYCSGAATEVLKFGSCQLRSGHKVLFLIIPGNPGVVGFYKTFMQTLHMMFGYQYPVWAASHAGHCVPPTSMDMVDDTYSAEEDDVFGLNGQIEHKLAFLRTHVPRETSLVLVGHSIGCYIILEMMKRNPELKVLKAVMLFPTIERMAQTPQGKVMTPVLCYMRYVAYLPLFLVSLLPDTIKAGLIKLVLGGISALDSSVIQPTVGLLSGDSGVWEVTNSLFIKVGRANIFNRMVSRALTCTVWKHRSSDFNTHRGSVTIFSPEDAIHFIYSGRSLLLYSFSKS
uniref:Lipid droplet-associated hydrolase n=1 Tax=Acanthochromis polyacanthus TaxID=80966 RepID=A0A3Q1E948_9TELE